MHRSLNEVSLSNPWQDKIKKDKTNWVWGQTIADQKSFHLKPLTCFFFFHQQMKEEKRARADRRLFSSVFTSLRKMLDLWKAFDQTLNFFISFKIFFTWSAAGASKRLFDSLERLEPFQIHALLLRLFAFCTHAAADAPRKCSYS